MKAMDLKELFAKAEELGWQGHAVVQGWVRTNRNSNMFGFIGLNDGTSLNLYRLCMKKTQ